MLLSHDFQETVGCVEEHRQCVFSDLPGIVRILSDTRQRRGSLGVAMGAVNGPPIPAGLRRVCLPLPGPAACGNLASNREGDIQLYGAVRRRLAAAVVVVVGVVLCMSWTHDPRIPAGFAMLNNHAIATAAQGKSAGAGAEKARCGPPVLFGKGPDSHRQQRGRVVLDAYVPSDAATDPPEVSASDKRGVLAASGIACRSARRWFLVSHQAVPFWLPGRHSRYGVRMLASGKWSAEGPVRPGPGACVTDKAAEQTQRRMGAAVFDPLGGAAQVSRAGASSPINLEAYRLRVRPSWPASLTCGMIRPDRQRAGTRAPERWCSAPTGSGGQTGASDRASLPGRSTRYRMIWFVCPHCGARMECLFYDEGDLPLCRNSLHGQMEIKR